MFPESTTFDEAARFLIRQGGGPLIAWLLEESPDELRFRGWLDSVLTLPGTKERLCDAIARLETANGEPVALLVEVQTKPDASMFGRLCVAGGILWITVKPNDLTGDRYGLLTLVVNLTGTGQSGRTFRRTSSVWEMSPCEWNLVDQDAESILAAVEAGKAPLEALALIPLMKKGDDDGIIQRWLAVVALEPNLHRRGNLKLAIVFAELTNCVDVWKPALEGLDVMESQVVKEWTEAASRRARREGAQEATAAAVLRCLRTRFGLVSSELAQSVNACTDMARLDTLFDAALKESTLDDFRRVTGL